jgi:hypothetical protein
MRRIIRTGLAMVLAFLATLALALPSNAAVSYLWYRLDGTMYCGDRNQIITLIVRKANLGSGVYEWNWMPGAGVNWSTDFWGWNDELWVDSRGRNDATYTRERTWGSGTAKVQTFQEGVNVALPGGYYSPFVRWGAKWGPDSCGLAYFPGYVQI